MSLGNIIGLTVKKMGFLTFYFSILEMPWLVMFIITIVPNPSTGVKLIFVSVCSISIIIFIDAYFAICVPSPINSMFLAMAIGHV